MIFAIVLAGGRGSRIVGSAIPKQYLSIGGMTLLERVTAAFSAHPAIDRIVLVVPAPDVEKVALMFRHASKPIAVVPGGTSRQASSKAGVLSLMKIAALDDIVLIHDAARVLVTSDIIDRAIASLEKSDAATAVIPAQDTLMKVKSGLTIEKMINRADIVMAQTPQAFRYRVIKDAHDRAQGIDATDDISLVLGTNKVHYFAGSPLNFKVTTAEDLRLLEAFIDKEPRP
jgi:2-C-methyl-D-erythritol 4-phosphate cytidylyltransferase